MMPVASTQVQSVPVADTNVVPAGSVSVTTIGAAAVAGPLLLTVTVHDASSPTVTVGVTVVFVITRSAC